MKNTFICWFYLLIAFPSLLFSQEESSKFDINGYLTLMPQYIWSDSLNFKQVLLNNRVNLTWYPSENFTITAQFRNQLLYGDLVKMGNYKDGFVTENYFLPFTFQQTFNTKGLLYVSTDRLFVDYTKNNLEVILGRQRINWGQTFVWNPNDIFNTYNFFDFDYAERPGADAIRIQYYTGTSSQIDIAAKIDSGNNVTAAALYRTNKWNIDFQFIGGYYSQPGSSYYSAEKTESDWVCGLALTSDFKGISLRSEASYLYPTKNSPVQDDLFLISTGLDYTISNDITVNAEFLYSSKVNLSLATGMMGLYSGPMTLKTMAYTKYSYFAQAAYPITPLLNASISGMVFTDETLDGFYLGPSLSYSLGNNLELSGFFQYFWFNTAVPLQSDKITISMNMAFLRFKWNF
jgi:hypothetical protein